MIWSPGPAAPSQRACGTATPAPSRRLGLRARDRPRRAEDEALARPAPGWVTWRSCSRRSASARSSRRAGRPGHPPHIRGLVGPVHLRRRAGGRLRAIPRRCRAHRARGGRSAPVRQRPVHRDRDGLGGPGHRRLATRRVLPECIGPLSSIWLSKLQPTWRDDDRARDVPGADPSARRGAEPNRRACVLQGSTRLSASSAGMMTLLRRHGDMTMSELTELLAVDISVTSRHVACVADQGWIERSPNPADGRSRILRLTDAGRDLLDNASHQLTDLIADRLSGWDERDVHELDGSSPSSATASATAAPPATRQHHQKGSPWQRRQPHGLTPVHRDARPRAHPPRTARCLTARSWRRSRGCCSACSWR